VAGFTPKKPKTSGPPGKQLRDPAYAIPDDYVGRTGLSWIHRWGLSKGMPVVSEPREPKALADAFAAILRRQ